MKTLYANGEIWCSRGRYTEAVLVENHKVIALGSDALSAQYDEKIDLEGKFLAPGFIDAGMQAPFFENPDVRDLRSSAVPLKRLGSADDVADCALFLASDKAKYISGENITVDGGVINSVLMQLPRS